MLFQTQQDHLVKILLQIQMFLRIRQSSITLRVKSIQNINLCLKIRNDSQELYNQKCIPIQVTEVSFGKLEPATKYLFEIYSYVTNSSRSLVLSTESCQNKFPTYTSVNVIKLFVVYSIHLYLQCCNFFMVYKENSNMISFICQTWHTFLYFLSGPLCLKKNNTNLEKNSTYTGFTFTIRDSHKTKQCIIKERNLQKNYSDECKPFEDTSVNFKSLKPDTEYSFGIFTYVDDSDGSKILSDQPCTEFTIYTSEFWSYHGHYTFTSINLKHVNLSSLSFFFYAWLIHFVVLRMYLCKMFRE